MKSHQIKSISMRLKIIFLLMFISASSFSTTWDEPWQDKVIREADYFVLAKIKSFDEKKGTTIEVIKSLGGPQLEGKIKITDFYLLELCSTSGGHGPEFHFKNIEEAYFFIKKDKKGKYCISTPTSGFDALRDGKVYATYRHSYHQALVPVDIYEKTMTAIFNNYHKQPYDKEFINQFISTNLGLKPAGFGEGEISTFFNQHVALECIYHLRLTGFYDKILPFLADTSNFHNQVSGARALVSCNTAPCKQELMNVISDTSRSGFVQVMCVWTLAEFKPSELKEKLIAVKGTIPDKDIGFGGNIMDPRVCTSMPGVKSAVEKLIQTL
jgi:hypothetical protein